MGGVLEQRERMGQFQSLEQADADFRATQFRTDGFLFG